MASALKGVGDNISFEAGRDALKPDEHHATVDSLLPENQLAKILVAGQKQGRLNC
ncbi:MAG: hypothetical protein SH868_08935 [Bythopirellula sp.]|nr:hypothetical protein [Bythopirellula sp.]